MQKVSLTVSLLSAERHKSVMNNAHEIFFLVGIRPLGFTNPRGSATSTVNVGRHREPDNEGDLAHREEEEEECNFYIFNKTEIKRR